MKMAVKKRAIVYWIPELDPEYKTLTGIRAYAYRIVTRGYGYGENNEYCNIHATSCPMRGNKPQWKKNTIIITGKVFRRGNGAAWYNNRTKKTYQLNIDGTLGNEIRR